MKTSWKDEPGKTKIILDEPLEGFENAGTELVIYWLSTGWYTPARRHGGWENLGEPADGDETRRLDMACLYTSDGDETTLPQEVASKLFEEYQEEIDKSELNIF